MPKQRMIDSYALMANRLRTESQAKCFNDKRDCHLWSVVTLKLGETNFFLAAIHLYLRFQRNITWTIRHLVNETINPGTERIILKIVGFQDCKGGQVVHEACSHFVFAICMHNNLLKHCPWILSQIFWHTVNFKFYNFSWKYSFSYYFFWLPAGASSIGKMWFLSCLVVVLMMTKVNF